MTQNEADQWQNIQAYFSKPSKAGYMSEPANNIGSCKQKQGLTIKSWLWVIQHMQEVSESRGISQLMTLTDFQKEESADQIHQYWTDTFILNAIEAFLCRTQSAILLYFIAVSCALFQDLLCPMGSYCVNVLMHASHYWLVFHYYDMA